VKYLVTHQTRYLYSDTVSISYNRVHSRPGAVAGQKSGNSKILIQPEPDSINSERDFFGNPIAFFTVQNPHRELEVTVSFDADVQEREIPVRSEGWDTAVGLLRETPDRSSVLASQFRHDSTWVRRSNTLSEFAASSFPKGSSVIEGARDLCSRIYREFDFDPTATTVATPLEDVLEKRKGVCQDFAHLALGGLRSLGLAARYVSGYILTLPPPGQTRLQGADASHAWISVWCPVVGWVDLDPTNDLVVSDQHVTLAVGRDYHDVCPMRGVVLGGGTQTVKVGVDVIPQSEVSQS
jgi:transglutaminase-like putative cysteine protease